MLTEKSLKVNNRFYRIFQKRLKKMRKNNFFEILFEKNLHSTLISRQKNRQERINLLW